MSWLEISVRVSRENAPLVEELLENQPVLALTLTDDADDPVLEPGVGETPLWPSVCVTALFDVDTPVEPITRLLSLVPGIDRPQQVNIREIKDQAWERAWMDRFQPMRFGRGLWILPGKAEIPAEASHTIRLDPGLAFGTGTHPTTHLCLEWIDGFDFSGKRVVDYGCGSGVLGIAAAIKGADYVACVDNDPQALIATVENADRNAVGSVIACFAPERFAPRAYDVVLANILAGPLVELAPRLAGCVLAGGELVLSGILEAQADEVKAAYEPAFAGLRVRILDGWVLLTGQKRD